MGLPKRHDVMLISGAKTSSCVSAHTAFFCLFSGAAHHSRVAVVLSYDGGSACPAPMCRARSTLCSGMWMALRTANNPLSAPRLMWTFDEIMAALGGVGCQDLPKLA